MLNWDFFNNFNISFTPSQYAMTKILWMKKNLSPQNQHFFKFINAFHLRYKASFQPTVVHIGVTSRGITKSYWTALLGMNRGATTSTVFSVPYSHSVWTLDHFPGIPICPFIISHTFTSLPLFFSPAFAFCYIIQFYPQGSKIVNIKWRKRWGREVAGKRKDKIRQFSLLHCFRAQIVGGKTLQYTDVWEAS